jgi:hypothetical protein
MPWRLVGDVMPALLAGGVEVWVNHMWKKIAYS